MYNKIAFSVLFPIVIMSSSVVQAQTSAGNWPSRPITFIVPSSPGGSTDTTARILAEGVSKYLGQPVIIENRSGASGVIGLQAALRAPGDGYTYVFGYTTNLVISQFTIKDLSFDARRDFEPVAGVAINEMVMSVSASIPAKSPREFVEWAKTQSGNLTYGSYGQGSYSHILANHLGADYGFPALHVPYKAEQEMLLALGTGDISYAVSVMPAGKRMQDAGKTRMIGVISPRRSELYPDLPTFKEMGMDDPAFQLLGWNGLFARKGVAEPILKKMEAAVLHTLAMPKVREKLAATSVLAWGGTARELDALWSADIPVYKELVDSAAAANE